MRLYIIRHADPDYENDTITCKGHMEAKALSNRMKKEKITKIYSSTMQRAIDTAQYTAQIMDLSITKCDWMREMEWESYVDDYINPWDIPANQLIEYPSNPTWDGWRNTTLFKSELVYKDYLERTEALDLFLKEQGFIRENRHYKQIFENDNRVAMFCHAGFGNAIISYLLNIPLTIQWGGFWMAPSSVTTLVFSKRNTDIVSPRCISYGDVSHLYKEDVDIQPRGYLGTFY